MKALLLSLTILGLIACSPNNSDSRSSEQKINDKAKTENAFANGAYVGTLKSESGDTIKIQLIIKTEEQVNGKDSEGRDIFRYVLKATLDQENLDGCTDYTFDATFDKELLGSIKIYGASKKSTDPQKPAPVDFIFSGNISNDGQLLTGTISRADNLQTGTLNLTRSNKSAYELATEMMKEREKFFQQFIGDFELVVTSSQMPPRLSLASISLYDRKSEKNMLCLGMSGSLQYAINYQAVAAFAYYTTGTKQLSLSNIPGTNSLGFNYTGVFSPNAAKKWVGSGFYGAQSFSFESR